jgi:hypothetical protein
MSDLNFIFNLGFWLTIFGLGAMFLFGVLRLIRFVRKLDFFD